MSMPTIPNIKPEITIKREEVVNLLLASIALEELGLAHIVNAEAEKLQYVLGTIEGEQNGKCSTDIDTLMKVNKSVQTTLRDTIKQEMLLQFKLEDVLGMSDDECEHIEE